MTEIEILPWPDFPAEHRARWTTFRASRPEYASPFFDLGFIDAVHAVRGDVDVAIAGRDRVMAFLPFHRDRLGALIPAAGPLSDWHGWMGDGAQVDPQALLHEARAHALYFSAAPLGDPMAPEGAPSRDSHLIDLESGAEAYFQSVANRSAKAMRNLRARERKALDAHGEIRFEADDRSPQALAQLMAWKSAQYRRTGQFDVFSRPWTRRLIEHLFESRSHGFEGRLSTLWFGDRLAAAHFGMRSGSVLHYWFPAYDEAFAALSPGLLLLLELARQAPQSGLSTIDLGAGDYRFKTDFANGAWPMTTATVCRPTLQGAARRGLIAAGKALAVVPGPVTSLPQRAVRRAYRDWTFNTAPLSPERCRA